MANVDESLVDAFQNVFLGNKFIGNKFIGNEFIGNEVGTEFLEDLENELQAPIEGIREYQEKKLVGLKGNSDRKEL